MTDTQILTIALSVIFPLAALIHSNSRVSDLRSSTDRQFTELGKQIADLKKHLDDRLDNGFDHMKLLLQLHEAQHHNGGSHGKPE